MGKEQGITLIEIMVVLAIIVVLASMAVPFFSQTFENVRLREAARKVYADLYQAKVKAMETGGCVKVSFNSSTNSYSMSLYNDPKCTVFNSTLGNVSVGDEFKDVSIANDVEIDFDNMGMTRGGVGSVELKDSKGRTVRVVVSFTGSVRIEQ